MLSAALSELTAGFPLVPRRPCGSLAFCVRTSTRTGTGFVSRGPPFDESIHRHQLAEGSAAQLECDVDVARLGAGKEL